MDFTEALARIDARTNFEAVGILTKPTLDPMREIMERLGHPQRSYPAIHITGTNGKTTTARVAAEVLCAAGLTVGTYTSPHLFTPRERIALNGEPISEEEFAKAVEYLAPFLAGVDALGREMTWFETVTALAFAWFADKAVDAAVVEVGMGGSWDATNVIDAPVAVITQIEVDHPELGSTPVAVAREKVGIVKEAAVVVSAESNPPVLAVLEKACQERGARLRLKDESFELTRRDIAGDGQRISIRLGERRYDHLFLPLLGARLAEDALLGIAGAAALLGDPELDDDLLVTALRRVKAPGRVEVVSQRPLVVLDGAHNDGSARALVKTMRESLTWDQLFVVFGSLVPHDPGEVLGHLSPIMDELIVAPLRSPRAHAIERLMDEGRAVALDVRAATSLASAVEEALSQAREADCVLITGSLYAVAETRQSLIRRR